MRNLKLTRREQDVMCVLWESEKPLIASEIAERNPDLKIITVQTVLKKLMEKELIEIADIVQAGKVLARCYRPVVTQEEYLKNEFQTLFPDEKKSTLFSKTVVAALLDEPDTDEAALNELEEMINRKRMELKSGQ